MSLIITCVLTVGLSFTPPDGYSITKVQAPAKKEASISKPVFTTAEATIGSCPRCSEKVEIYLKPTGKAEPEIELPAGCSGQDIGVTFKTKPLPKNEER